MARTKTLDSKKNRDRFLLEYSMEGATLESAAYKVGIDPSTVWRYIQSNSNAEFNAEVEAIKEKNRAARAARICNKAEGKLEELVERGNPSAVFFALKTRGGWHENQNVNVSGNIDVEIVYGDEQQKS